jgi:hypothetical protein
MKRVEFGGVVVEVDEKRTSSLYEDRYDGCQCDGCTNARVTRVDATPPRQVEIITALGLDYQNPYLSASERRPHHRRPGYSRRNSCWVAYGTIIGAESTPQVSFDRWNWIWTDSSRSRAGLAVENLVHMKLDSAGLIYIVASNSIPRLYLEVCGFRSERGVQACPRCNSHWRETGYLKRTSRIPDWYGVPELRGVLRNGKQRVYVEFCSECGRMEHRLVDDKPPFRRKSLKGRDQQRIQRRILRAIERKGLEAVMRELSQGHDLYGISGK